MARQRQHGAPVLAELGAGGGLATSALDPETTRCILDLLRQVNRELGVTVVLNTHQMQVIKQIADRVAVIDAGRIVEMGPVIVVFTRLQQDITKSLIDEIVPQELTAGVLSRVLPDVMLAVVVILIVFVQAIQSLGDWVVRRMSHR